VATWYELISGADPFEPAKPPPPPSPGVLTLTETLRSVVRAPWSPEVPDRAWAGGKKYPGYRPMVVGPEVHEAWNTWAHDLETHSGEFIVPVGRIELGLQFIPQPWIVVAGCFRELVSWASQHMNPGLEDLWETCFENYITATCEPSQNLTERVIDCLQITNAVSNFKPSFQIFLNALTEGFRDWRRSSTYPLFVFVVEDEGAGPALNREFQKLFKQLCHPRLMVLVTSGFPEVPGLPDACWSD